MRQCRTSQLVLLALALDVGDLLWRAVRWVVPLNGQEYSEGAHKLPEVDAGVDILRVSARTSACEFTGIHTYARTCGTHTCAETDAHTYIYTYTTTCQE